MDAEVVVVDEAEVRGNLTGARLVVLHAAAKAIESHCDYGITGLPIYGAVLGVVGYAPDAGLGLDEGLISHLAHARGRMYSIVVVLGREVIDGGVLIEVVGSVGFAFGGRAVSDVIVGIGNFVCGNQFIADVVTILLVIDKNTATTKEGRSPL